MIALSLLVSPLWFVGARRAHLLALRGITEADALFKESYARELLFLRKIGRHAANASALAASRGTEIYNANRRPPAPMQTAQTEPDTYLEPWGDIPSPGILPTTPGAPKRGEKKS